MKHPPKISGQAMIGFKHTRELSETCLQQASDLMNKVNNDYIKKISNIEQGIMNYEVKKIKIEVKISLFDIYK